MKGNSKYSLTLMLEKAKSVNESEMIVLSHAQLFATRGL